MKSWNLQQKRWVNVALSIDGRKSSARLYALPFRNGKGSGDLVLPKFKKFADSRDQKQYYVRYVGASHLDFAEDVPISVTRD